MPGRRETVPKAAVVIVWGGALACALLVVRQSRLQAANELAEAQLRVRSSEERLAVIKAEISRLTAPEAVATMAEEHPDFRPPKEPEG